MVDKKDGLGFVTKINDVIVHEIMHTIVNPLVDPLKPQIKDDFDTIFPYVEDMLLKKNYARISMNTEWFTRMFTNIYLAKTTPYIILMYYNMMDDEKTGFIWQRKAVEHILEFIDKDEKNFDKDIIIAELVKYLGYVADNIETIKEEYSNISPYVKEEIRINGYSEDSGKDYIEFKTIFSERMRVDVLAINYLFGNEEYQVKDSDIFEEYWENEYTFVVKLGTDLIENIEFSGFTLKRGFQSKYGYSIKKDYEVKYNK